MTNDPKANEPLQPIRNILLELYSDVVSATDVDLNIPEVIEADAKATQAIQDYVDSEVLEARIYELKYVKNTFTSPEWLLGIRKYCLKRIKELNKRGK